MNKILKFPLTVLLFLVCNQFGFAQAERGYFDAPYTRYEADKAKLNGAKATNKSYNQGDLQSEASEQICVDMSAQKSFAEFKLTNVGDGLVIRYSIPDSTDGELEAFVNGKSVGTIKLTTQFSWEYLWNNGNPNNSGVSNKNPKMRFDEVRFKLPAKIPVGGILKLANKKGKIYLDFIELENIPEPLKPNPTDAVFNPNEEDADLQSFIDKNGGKTIFVPTGVYNLNRDLYFGNDNTTLRGAGMWYTQLHFTKIKWLKGGLYANAKKISFLDLYLTTENNSRSNSYKAINGIFTEGSIIKNVWAEHFECGAWIAQYNSGEVLFAEKFLVTNCRFRNNYADGINLCKGTKNASVEHCNFRNNGDDDMAIWSADNMECQNNTFSYCTSENCWRASGCAIYGGLNNKAHHLLIRDNLEVGIRVNNSFPGVGFNNEGLHEFSDITIIRCGTNNDLYNNPVGAIDIACTDRCGMKIKNVRFSNIDIIDSKNDAIYMFRWGGDSFLNISFENIMIDGTGKEYPFNDEKNTNKEFERGFGLNLRYKPQGDISYCNFVIKNQGGNAASLIYNDSIGKLNWKPIEGCNKSLEMIK